MRISDWSSDVCSSDLSQGLACLATRVAAIPELVDDGVTGVLVPPDNPAALAAALARLIADPAARRRLGAAGQQRVRADFDMKSGIRSEEHTSELQSLMRISYAVFCLEKTTRQHNNSTH